MSETVSNPVPVSAHPLAPLHDPGTIRARCRAVLHAVESGVSPNFSLDRSRMAAVADRVAALTLRRFPDLQVPYHSRWRHFEAGGVDRKAELDAALAGRSRAEVARAQFDLVVVSVLLDAGAGPSWRYVESRQVAAAGLLQAPADDLLAMLDRSAAGVRASKAAAQAAAEAQAADQAAEVAEGSPADPAAGSSAPAAADHEAAALDAAPTAVNPPEPAPAPAVAAAALAEAPAAPSFTRSEGLAVASFRAFMAGAFSSKPGEPARADAAALRHVDAAALRALFQSSPVNPMVGLEGRAVLLSRLGLALQSEGQRSGHEARPGLIYDRLTANGVRTEVSAAELLGEVLRSLSSIWPSGSLVQGLPAGDVWPHRWAGAAVGVDGARKDRTTEGWVPFHKLSQWMSWSLIEPLQWAGVQVRGLDALTGLPEYRNGGLLLDGGVIVPRNPRLLARTWRPADDFIIEWRALTVALLDELADAVRQRLGRDADSLPLACILEGGTWAAGREIARELRADGAPPLKIDSDGTLF